MSIEIKTKRWYKDTGSGRLQRVLSLDTHLVSIYCSVDGPRNVNRSLFELAIESGELVLYNPSPDELNPLIHLEVDLRETEERVLDLLSKESS